jgi:cell fate (sporulation/competence/biofilm development) regulator YlbF (YheA/YmcA/DUF963 family)
MTAVQIKEKTIELNEVREAAHKFASVLALSPQYQAFERAYEALRRDGSAQQAISAFQDRQRAWQTQMMLGILSPAEQDELRRLQQRMMTHPTVQNHLRCQEELSALCQRVNEIITSVIGLNFAASCGPGCC